MNSDYKKLINNTIVICFSAGQTSAFMTKSILDDLGCRPAFRNGIPCHISKYNRYVFVIFNNTSKEREESLQFVKDCDDNFGFRTVWLQAVITQELGKGVRPEIVSFETAKRDGSVFEDFIKKHGLPNRANPKCTGVLKTQNTNAFIAAQELGKCFQIVGIRIDEPHRLKFKEAKKLRLIYYLATIKPTTKFEVIHFFNNQSFRLMLKSYEGNCDMCYKKSIRKIMTLCIERPDLTIWWDEMEEKYGYYIPQSHRQDQKLPKVFYREFNSIKDLLEDAKNTNFELAKDETELKAYYLSNPELDNNEECGESCDAFTDIYNELD